MFDREQVCYKLSLEINSGGWQPGCTMPSEVSMADTEREREVLTQPLTLEHIERRSAAGWRVHAIEWERGASTAETAREEVPFGLRVAGDCRHLEEDPAEVEAMMTVMEGIVQDHPLSQIAADLGRRGFRMRDGRSWSQVSVFNLLPRLIEFSPRFLNREDWVQRRRGLKLVG
jgi:hypothetical protein